MAQPGEGAALDDERASQTLDVHFGLSLGCSAADLRRPGWRVFGARAEFDPMEVLFGQRALLTVVAPLGRDAAMARGGVAVVDPELRARVAAALMELPPQMLFGETGLRAFAALLRHVAQAPLTLPDEAYMRVYAVSQVGFRPYRGELQEWIEPLDEAREVEPEALGLVARYGAGVWVIRQRGAIIAFAGVRQQSPHVAEVSVGASVGASVGDEGQLGQVGQAVLSRATRGILAAGRAPLYRCAPANSVGVALAEALGYRLYADTLTCYATTR